ncbi:hypothetical protein Cgig2_016873 [Carnegiea gigantea]|uniref:START domain-containing protein n=1 Tax=Carnegiea gigantea TaxID=171969 RepID=A0A9Q1QDX2_9CARY|nr:hypothetical protein Cgig2_016873 [Carnegiea gigantea]
MSAFTSIPQCLYTTAPYRVIYGITLGRLPVLQLQKLKNGWKHLIKQSNRIDLDARRHRVRRYAHGLIKLIKIGQGPEPLLRQSSALSDSIRTDGYLGADGDTDAIEPNTWRCVCTINGIRIFEDVEDSKGGRNVLVKSVGIIDASADTVVEVILSLEPSRRYEWDMLTSDLELVESIDANYDVVYGIYDPKYFTWFNFK